MCGIRIRELCCAEDVKAEGGGGWGHVRPRVLEPRTMCPQCVLWTLGPEDRLFPERASF